MGLPAVAQVLGCFIQNEYVKKNRHNFSLPKTSLRSLCYGLVYPYLIHCFSMGIDKSLLYKTYHYPSKENDLFKEQMTLTFSCAYSLESTREA